MLKTPHVKWLRTHLIIALNLYCKIPFGKLHRNNPIIVEVAARLGRTSNSLAMKLCNFASLDPVLAKRGIKGLPGVSLQDRLLWTEFNTFSNGLALESEILLHDLFTSSADQEVTFLNGTIAKLENQKGKFFDGPTEQFASVTQRRGQHFFRQVVLNAYGVRCCISGICVPQLLVASHIKPWCKFPDERLNPRNGLCLSSLHDDAFDSGLIALDDSLKLVLSKKLKAYLPHSLLEQNFLQFEGRSIQQPEILAEPELSFLQFHRNYWGISA